MRENITLEKSEEFAIRVVNLCKYLTEKKKEFVLSKQILRSGTSIGANLSEAECAISKNDWINKLHISYKECSETKYWLRLLKNTKYISQKEFDSIYIDCDSIIKMLTSSLKTIKRVEN